jgi:hypothetical protein
VPLFYERTLNEDQTSVDLNENPWSMDFAIACSNLAWYGRPKDLNATPYPVWRTKEWNTAVYRTKDRSTEVTITRQASPYLVHLLALKKCVVHPEITFVVRARSDMNYYLMYDDYAGAFIVNVDKIMPPDDTARNEMEKWKETVSYRRAFDTVEAVKFSKGTKGKGSNRGHDYFRKLLDSEAEMGADEDGRPYTTYHLGDAYYTGDIRKFVGVVRWKLSDMEVPDHYFPEYLQADLVSIGVGRRGRCAERRGVTRND